ncbi:MAG: hypothetical protein QG665_421 [Patescibacteria group bacterium]|nr:hypothetical protein [Patescibacteria group bacterium]
MHNIIWRNRANVGLSLFVVILALFSGFPDYIDTILFVVSGGLIALFSFTASRYVWALDHKDKGANYRQEESFAESGPVAKEDIIAAEDTEQLTD